MKKDKRGINIASTDDGFSSRLFGRVIPDRCQPSGLLPEGSAEYPFNCAADSPITSNLRVRHCGVSPLVIVSVSSVSVAGRRFFFPENNQCFVDQNSKQPTAKSAFIFELRRIAGSGDPAALQSIFRFFITA